MGNAISICFKKYGTFSGRAKRSEYWFFYLFYVLVYIGATLIDSAQGTALVTSIAALVLVIPLLELDAAECTIRTTPAGSS